MQNVVRHFDTKYLWISDFKYNDLDTTLIDSFKLNAPSIATQKLIYYTGIDSVVYLLGQDTMSLSETNWNRRPKSKLNLIKDTTIITYSDSLRVFKYLQKGQVENGDFFHYWAPKIGVFAIHSNTSGSLTILKTNDTTINKRIYRLIESNIDPIFTHGIIGVALND